MFILIILVQLINIVSEYRRAMADEAELLLRKAEYEQAQAENELENWE
jgi:hypothetical protein